MEQQFSIKKGNTNKRVKWDQQALKETQKYRGTYQKIIEPKTPYNQKRHHFEDMDQQTQKTQEQAQLDQNLHKAQYNKNKNRHNKFNLEELNAKLKQQMDKMQLQGNGYQDEQTQQQKVKHQQFKKKRAAHYNQFKMIQQNKNNWQDSDDD